jgi:hypothetical protein
MTVKKLATVALAIIAILVATGYLAWTLIAYGLIEFAKGGVC